MFSDVKLGLGSCEGILSSDYSLQSLGSAQKNSWSRDSSSSPLSHIEEDHVYRYELFPWKRLQG